MNEITLQSRLSASKNGSSVATLTSQISVNMQTALTAMSALVQSVGTSRVAVNTGTVDISNAGGSEYWLRLRNNHSTNIITVEVQTGASAWQKCGRLRPGETWGPVRLEKKDTSGYGGLFLTASAAGTDVEVVTVAAGDPTL